MNAICHSVTVNRVVVILRGSEDTLTLLVAIKVV